MNIDVPTVISTRMYPAEMTAACGANGLRFGVATARRYLMRALRLKIHLEIGRHSTLNAKNVSRRMYASGRIKSPVLCAEARCVDLKKSTIFATDLVGACHG